MPLLIKGHVDDQEPTIECDGYIPLVLRWTRSSLFPPIYWRLGDFEYSLIELGVNEQTGAICEVTVTSLASITEGLPFPKVGPTEFLSGLPCCDLKLWPEEVRRIDERSEIQAFYEKSTFLLRIIRSSSQINSPSRVEYRSGNVCFRLDQENALREIEVRNLSEIQMENLVSCV